MFFLPQRLHKIRLCLILYKKKKKKITLTRPKDRTRDPVLQKISNKFHVTIPARLSVLTLTQRFNPNLLSAPPFSEQIYQFVEVEINQICDFWRVKTDFQKPRT